VLKGRISGGSSNAERRAVGGPDGIGLCIAEKVLSAKLFVI